MSRPQISPPSGAQRALVEWPTLGMIAVCYAAWLGLLALGVGLPVVVWVPAMAVVMALHSSLQHEVLHGHPFRSASLSEAMVFPAIGLLVPYQRFRDLHLQHHYDPNLTDPFDDPETNYMDPAQWAATPAGIKVIYRFNNTLLGRMVVGPALSLIALYKEDTAVMLRGDNKVLWAYGLHFLGVIPVVWGVLLSSVPFGAYLAATYLGFSLLKIRTFLEHRAHEKVPGRTVVIESRGPLALLFLNNNYHSVHHAHPTLPWYRLPGFYAERRAQFLERNQSYFYRSYVDVFRQYFLKAKDPVPHPLRNRVDAQKQYEAQ